MAETLAPAPMLKDLLSHVGLLLLRWGQVERKMRGVVGEAKGLTAASRQGQALIWAWRDVAQARAAGDERRRLEVSRAAEELETLRPLRNLVCHGIQSATSEPFAGRAPGLHCWLEDQETVVSWRDLDEAVRRLEGLAPSIR
ncbi:MAG: hypothetical protein JWM33_2328 [Caulobacteraceae bacterium]|nr:hypothetical protein [Caulobacteraceae bacterium]